MKNTKTFRVIAGATLGLALALGAPLAASAHVTVSPEQAEPGSYAALTFRVPNESDTAGTISLAVDLPQDTPFASVSYEPVPGWSVTVERGPLDEPVQMHGTEVTEAATRVVWTADEDVQIAPGEFQRFVLSVGPVPEVGSIAFAATQTYSDGEVVEWADTAEGADYPAPVLYVTDTPAGGHHGSGSHDDSDHADGDETAGDGEQASSSSDDGLARGLAIAALVIAAAGVLLAAYAAFGRRRA